MLSFEALVLLISALITIGVSLFLAILVFLKNRTPEMGKVFMLWMAVSILNAAFLIGYIVSGQQFVWQVLGLLTAVLDPCITIHFIMLFTEKSDLFTKRKHHRIFPYIPAFIFYALISSPFVGYLTNPAGYDSIITSFLQQSLPAYFTIITFLIMLPCIILLYITYTKATALRKHDQLRFIIVGVCFLFVSILANTIMLILETHGITSGIIRDTFSYVQFIIVPVSAILFTYVILRYKMLDVKVFIHRSAVAGVLSLSMIAIFIPLSSVLEYILGNFIFGESNTWVSNVIAGFVVFPLCQPLQNIVEKAIEKVAGKRELHISHETEIDLYNSLLNTAWADGNVSDKEEEMLFTLRETLHITDEERKQLELSIKKKLRMA